MCTCINYTSTDNVNFLGRTQEYNINFNYKAVQFPRAFHVTQAISPWNTRYAVLGIGVRYEPIGLTHLLIDGVNEEGLAGVSQYFSEFNRYATVEEIKQADKLPLQAEQFIFWVLANCKDIDEVKKRIAEVAIADLAFTGEAPGLPQHFMFTDKSGRSIVVEPSKKLGFDVYDNNDIGVMTNNPKYDWHVVNLQNYTGISDTNEPAIQMGDLTIPSSGKGSGLHGIPGDSTPASRFVRAALLKKMCDPVDSDHAVNTVFHLLATSDIVKGTIKLTDKAGDRQYTQYTSVYDLAQRRLFVKVYDNISIQQVDFDREHVCDERASTWDLINTQQFHKLN